MSKDLLDNFREHTFKIVRNGVGIHKVEEEQKEASHL